MSTRTRRQHRQQQDSEQEDHHHDGLSDFSDQHQTDDDQAFHASDTDAQGDGDVDTEPTGAINTDPDGAGEERQPQNVTAVRPPPAAEVLDAPAGRNVSPPTTPPVRRVRIAEPARRDRSRRTLRRERRARSSDSDEYITSQEEAPAVEEIPRARRPASLADRVRRNVGEAGGEGHHLILDADGYRDRHGRRVAFMSTTREVPPPQPRDPTLYFTAEAKMDERYGMACAKALAQMAVRDNREDMGRNPEPELIAYNLRQAGAAHLISHARVVPMPEATPEVSPQVIVDSSNMEQPVSAGQRKRGKTLPLSHGDGGNVPAMRMPTYEGGNWSAFKQQFEKLSRYYGWDDETKAAQLHTNIRGTAADAIGFEDSWLWTYDELITHLEKRHGRTKKYVDVLNETCAQYRKQDETLTQWHDRVIKIANQAPLTAAQYRYVTYQGFTYGLRSYPDLQSWVLNKDTKGTLQSAIDLAEEWEDEHRGAIYVHPSLNTGSAFVNQKTVHPTGTSAGTEEVAQLRKLVTDLQSQVKGGKKNKNKNKGNSTEAQAPAEETPATADAGSNAGDTASQTSQGSGRGKGRNRRGRGRGGRGGNRPPSDEQVRSMQNTFQWFAQQAQQPSSGTQQYTQPPPQAPPAPMFYPFFPPPSNPPPSSMTATPAAQQHHQNAGQQGQTGN